MSAVRDSGTGETIMSERERELDEELSRLYALEAFIH